MAACFCKQPCEKHKFPVMRKRDWLNAVLAFKKENPEALVLVDVLRGNEQEFMNKWGYE